MSATNVSIRLGVEGKAEIKRAFEEVGRSGQAAFGSVEKAMDRTGAATDREVARFKRLAEAARMAGEADASQKRFNTVLNVDRPIPKSARDSASVFEEAALEAESFAARANALRAAIDPLGAAQARLNAELAEYATLAQRGAITSTEHAAAQALARQRFDQTSQAIKGVGGATGLTRFQLQTLQYTFNDVIASMSTGMSPMTILMQQGGQVTQAFGGLRGTLAAFGSALGVVGGIVAGVAVAAAGLTMAWMANDASNRAVATALMGIGRASGATTAELERIAHSAAETGKVSVTAAREMEVAFLRTGKIGAEEMGRAIGVARNFAVTMGVETKAGAEQLATALADPARGADELNSRLAFLDDRTRQYVRTLADQNDRTGAQRVLLDALAPALGDAEQATHALGRAWNYVARQASDAFDAVGKAVDRAVDGRNPSEELDLLKWRRDRLRENSGGNVVPLMLPQVERRIAEIEAQLADQQQRAARLATDARANELSVRAGETARDIIPGARDLERLRREQATLRAALDDPLARSKLADVGEVEAAYRRVTGEIDLVGRSESERGLVIAQLRAEQGLRSRGIDLASEEGQQIINNAGRIERLTQELQKQDAAYRGLENAAGSALDRFGDVLAQGKTDWKSWADAGRSALQDISREVIKLAVLKGNFASEIAAALHRALGSTHAGVKTAAGWTGANERTVKNWFSGRYGPSGEHLVVLAHHSDEIMNTFVRMAGRQDLIVAVKLAVAEDAIADLLLAVRSMNGGRT